MNKAVNNKSKLLYQLHNLRKLSQPFFLPIDQCNGFQFIWLLISLLFCVGGVELVGLTGIISFWILYLRNLVYSFCFYLFITYKLFFREFNLEANSFFFQIKNEYVSEKLFVPILLQY